MAVDSIHNILLSDEEIPLSHLQLRILHWQSGQRSTIHLEKLLWVNALSLKSTTEWGELNAKSWALRKPVSSSYPLIFLQAKRNLENKDIIIQKLRRDKAG
ncbi:hypothetical protein EUGRSUZ_E00612 [Eucalyptus grandis]|uniref:Uncharacterized protein n=2 Tax=Eucalyptus grandis TaxID=71139 RepID=A0ACC3KRY1_EUCGR|nr:hypothetical protein EUGRSUZ_E00612 [Eucalyptus grandis]